MSSFVEATMKGKTPEGSSRRLPRRHNTVSSHQQYKHTIILTDCDGELSLETCPARCYAWLRRRSGGAMVGRTYLSRYRERAPVEIQARVFTNLASAAATFPAAFPPK